MIALIDLQDIHNMKTDDTEQQPKSVRILRTIKIFEGFNPFSNGMMAYATLMELVNSQEDSVWGAEHWNPPRKFLKGEVTNRIYPTYPESFEDVPGFPGVVHLIHTKHSVFISRYGAIQIQLDNAMPVSVCFTETRPEYILLDKADIYGDGVWHEKNRR